MTNLASTADSHSQTISHGCPGPTGQGKKAAVVLDVKADVAGLTAALMDIESVSGNEAALADAVELALAGLPHLQVTRNGDAIVARTSLGRAERVILAGHLDTVPLPTTPGSRGTVPSSWEVRCCTAGAPRT